MPNSPKVVLLESLSEESRTATIATLKIMMVPDHIVIPLLLTPRLSPPRSDPGDPRSSSPSPDPRHPRLLSPQVRNKTQVIAPDDHIDTDNCRHRRGRIRARRSLGSHFSLRKMTRSGPQRIVYTGRLLLLGTDTWEK
ncbi:hypothetical protein E4U51_006428 [Claviceps purpurea]|nr:hypothetical protein E4U51_006428 [Claviceps purpurea]